MLWLVVMAALLTVGLGTGFMARAQRWAAISNVIFTATTIAGLGWSFWGVMAGRRNPIVKWIGIVVLGTLSVLAITGMWPDLRRLPSLGFYEAPFGLLALDWVGSAVAITGMWWMAVCFFLGLWLLRMALSPGSGFLAVARTVVDEAVHMRIALIFIIFVVFLVPVVPVSLDPAERLSYRVQSFLSYSLMGVAMLLSLLTLFLSCMTVCNELKYKQIYLTLTKPLSRAGYLAGKLLGIGLLNLLLLSVAGLGIYVFTHVLEKQPHKDIYDRIALQSQVLVARQRIQPTPPPEYPFRDLLDKRIKTLREADPEKYRVITPKMEDELKNTVLASWMSIPPRDDRTYLFPGVGVAKQYGRLVQLRIKPIVSSYPPDTKVRFAMWVNGRPFRYDPETRTHLGFYIEYNRFHIVDIPLDLADADGNMAIRIRNEDIDDPSQSLPHTLTFTRGEGMEMLYQVGSFDWNLVRTLVIIWSFLLFLAMLGLSAGTFLSFPTACLLCFVVLFACLLNDYLRESIKTWGMSLAAELETQGFKSWSFFEAARALFTKGDLWVAAQVVARNITVGVTAVVPSFTQFNPIPEVIEGRLVPTSIMLEVLWKVGLAGTVGVGVVGWVIFRVRELARVVV